MGPGSGPVQDQGGNPKAVILHQSRLSRGDYLALRTRSPYDDGWPMPAHFIPVASASGSVNRNIHPPEGKPKPERKIVLSKKSPLLNASIPKFPPRALVSDYAVAFERSPRNQAAPAEGKDFERCVSITSSDAKGAIGPPVPAAAEVVRRERFTRVRPGIAVSPRASAVSR